MTEKNQYSLNNDIRYILCMLFIQLLINQVIASIVRKVHIFFFGCVTKESFISAILMYLFIIPSYLPYMVYI